MRGRIKLSGVNWQPMDLYCGYDVPSGDAKTSRRLGLNYDKGEGSLDRPRASSYRTCRRSSRSTAPPKHFTCSRSGRRRARSF